MKPEERIQILLGVLAAQADPQNAPAMSKYMRDQFPFFGIRSTQRARLVRSTIGKVSTWPELRYMVELLYAQPQREAHYAALDLLEKNPRVWTEEVIDVMEQLVLTHSWWDTVDRLASPLLGKALDKFPPHRDRPDHWIANESIWLRRVALIYQLKAREQTDRERLGRYIENTMASKQFFLRKAIGWALRQYGYTDPDWVRNFVENHREGLSPLSVREATRALPKN